MAETTSVSIKMNAPLSPRSPLAGVNIMLLGPTGTGKTTSLKTLLASGITPFCIFTEPGYEVLGDAAPGTLNWQYIPPLTESLDTILAKADQISRMTYDQMSKVTDFNRGKDNRLIEIVKAFNNFRDDRTGREFGPVAKWGTDRALVVDSLTGLGMAAMGAVIGSKPVKSQSDWGIAQDQVEGIINWACTAVRCHFVLIAHAEREVDEVLGGANIMASTLGKKLAPKLPRFFSDVILARRLGTEFSWSTAAAGADLKARNLPINDKLPPSFVQIIETWKSHGGLVEEATP